mmetsp:Transcript_98042/g.297628  ORF Transcript_98042/g.297628 Transcript_98042/m.297628 type:complete len:314 (-) Transcript_98042:94-1035(-)
MASCQRQRPGLRLRAPGGPGGGLRTLGHPGPCGRAWRTTSVARRTRWAWRPSSSSGASCCSLVRGASGSHPFAASSATTTRPPAAGSSPRAPCTSTVGPWDPAAPQCHCMVAKVRLISFWTPSRRQHWRRWPPGVRWSRRRQGRPATVPGTCCSQERDASMSLARGSWCSTAWGCPSKAATVARKRCSHRPLKACWAAPPGSAFSSPRAAVHAAAGPPWGPPRLWGWNWHRCRCGTQRCSSPAVCGGPSTPRTFPRQSRRSCVADSHCRAGCSSTASRNLRCWGPSEACLGALPRLPQKWTMHCPRCCGTPPC